MNYILLIVVTVAGVFGGASSTIEKIPMPSKQVCEQQAYAYNQNRSTKGYATCLEVAPEIKK